MKDIVGDKAKYRVRDGLMFVNFRRQLIKGVVQKTYDPNKLLGPGEKILATMEDLEGQVHKVTRVHPIVVYCQKCGLKFETVEPLPENAACPECKVKGADMDKKRRRIDANPIKDRMDHEPLTNRNELGVEVVKDDPEDAEESKEPASSGEPVKSDDKTKEDKDVGLLVKCNDCGHEFHAIPGKGGLPYVFCPECKKRGVNLVK